LSLSTIRAHTRMRDPLCAALPNRALFTIFHTHTAFRRNTDRPITPPTQCLRPVPSDLFHQSKWGHNYESQTHKTEKHRCHAKINSRT
jgi:hypothetical protein